MRLGASTHERLEARGRASGGKSALALCYIEEGLRTDEHPGIVFRPGPAGRRPGLAAATSPCSPRSVSTTCQMSRRVPTSAGRRTPEPPCARSGRSAERSEPFRSFYLVEKSAPRCDPPYPSAGSVAGRPDAAIVVIEHPDDDFHRYAGRSGLASQLAQEPVGEVLVAEPHVVPPRPQRQGTGEASLCARGRWRRGRRGNSEPTDSLERAHSPMRVRSDPCPADRAASARPKAPPQPPGPRPATHAGPPSQLARELTGHGNCATPGGRRWRKAGHCADSTPDSRVPDGGRRSVRTWRDPRAKLVRIHANTQRPPMIDDATITVRLKLWRRAPCSEQGSLERT